MTGPAQAPGEKIEGRGIGVDDEDPADGPRTCGGLGLQTQADRRDGLRQDRLGIGRRSGRAREVASGGPHEVHHGVDLVEEAARRIVDVAEDTDLAVVARPGLLGQQLAVAEDRGDGRAQLVPQETRSSRRVTALHEALRR